MERESRGLRVLTAAGLAAALFALFWIFPLSGDDWFREGLGASLHSVGGLVRVVVEKWNSTNGRILGNVLAYSAGSRPLLRALLRTSLTLALVLLLARAAGLRSVAGVLVCAAAVLALPREMFREIYPWAAGYFNYVPPVVCLLAAFVLLEELFDGGAPRGSVGRALALLALGFAAQLFVENVTACTLCAAGILNLWYLIREKKLSPVLLCYLAGALLGAVLLFASPSYAAMLRGGGSYQTGASGGLAGLLAAARENNPVVFRFLLTGCPVLYGSIAALLTLAFARVEKRAADALLLTALLANTAALPCAEALDLSDRATMMACLCWFALAAIGAARWTAGAVRSKTLFALFAALCAALPLLFVSPIGPRCLYASYVLLLWAAGSLLAPVGLQGRAFNVLGVVLCALVTLFYAATYAPLSRAVAEQQAQIRASMARGEGTVLVPASGGERWLWEPDSAKMTYAYYYTTPGDLTIVFETR